MDKRGQAHVEYALLLLVFAAIAASVWQAFPAAIGRFYEQLSERRAGMGGTFP